MPELDLAPTLRTWLLDDAAIAALVGGKVYPGLAPERIADAAGVEGPLTLPFVVMGISDSRQPTNADGPCGIEFETWEFTAWAASREAAVALGILVKARLQSYPDAFYLKKFDVLDMEPNSRAVSAFGRKIVFEIAYSQAE